jgi:hypothetical protein
MNTFRIKRRVSGGTGAPSSLLNAELAYNEVDDVLYYGKGIASGVTAAVVQAVGGLGMFQNYVAKAGNESIAGVKTFTSSPVVPTLGVGDNSTAAANSAYVRSFAQPLASSLTSLAALATLGLTVQTATGVYSARTIVAVNTGRIVISNGDGVGGNPSIDLATSGITAGAYPKATFDAYGRAVSGTNLTSDDVTTGLGFTPENVANKGVANGYAGLDGTGKVPVAQLPASVIGGMNYQGGWNASTNTPTLVNGTGTKGYYYKVTVAGTTTIDGNTNWTVGDSIAFDGTTWDKFEGGQPDVVSVAGRIGAVVLTTADIGGLGTMATQNSNSVNITGGTVAGSTVSGNITGNAANVTGVVAVANGGTGAATLTGYVKGTGTAALTASATIPNTDVTGLGTMSTQNSSAVSITGGTIDGVTFDGGTF